MELWESVVLGLVQGLTEFLPVSSSGHLVLAEKVLDFESVGLGFEVWVHLATLAAVAFALRREILLMVRGLWPGARDDGAREGRRYWVLALIGTVPAAVFGIAAEDAISAAFDSVRVVGVDLLITAAFLFASRFIPARAERNTPLRAFLIGVAQACAIFPGISRSGATLAAGLAAGLPGAEAARFSFILAFPAILGAAVFEIESLVTLGQTEPAALALSFLAAMGSGYLAIRIVWRVMTRGRLFLFAPYCALVGLLVLFLSFR